MKRCACRSVWACVCLNSAIRTIHFFFPFAMRVFAWTWTMNVCRWLLITIIIIIARSNLTKFAKIPKHYPVSDEAGRIWHKPNHFYMGSTWMGQQQQHIHSTYSSMNFWFCSGYKFINGWAVKLRKQQDVCLGFGAQQRMECKSRTHKQTKGEEKQKNINGNQFKKGSRKNGSEWVDLQRSLGQTATTR